MKTEKELYTEVQTAETLLENEYAVDIEGWWQVWRWYKHREYVYIRFDHVRQDYVVDVIGQELYHSGELRGYTEDNGWYFQCAKEQ